MQIVIFRRYRLEPGSLQEGFSWVVFVHRRYVLVVWTGFMNATFLRTECQIYCIGSFEFPRMDPTKFAAKTVNFEFFSTFPFFESALILPRTDHIKFSMHFSAG